MRTARAPSLWCCVTNGTVTATTIAGRLGVTFAQVHLQVSAFVGRMMLNIKI
jgi:hypothetical protein